MPNNRLALSLAALLMGSALSQPAMAGWFDSGPAKDDKAATDKKTSGKSDTIAPAQNLDGAIRQAQQQRLDGHYEEAVKQLSQIMLVAADDPRVVTEYGKTLAAMGRAADAVNFLTRAQQLSPNDWSVYSALGVAYDQGGDQQNARAAYEHALKLNPSEPSVLNNYALSRMLAKDPEGAKALIARAESSGGASDPKIARNIAMIKQLTPATGLAAAPALPPGAQAPHVAAAAGAPHPLAVAAAPMQPSPPLGAPRPLVANTPVTTAPLAQAQPSVVMQHVPVDPLAGPVKTANAKVVKPAPAPVKTADAKPEAKVEPQVQPKALPPKAGNQPDKALEARAEDLAKLLGKAGTAKADAKPVTKVADAKPAPVKTAEAKPAPVATTAKPATKTADAKANPVKTADAKAVPAAAKKDAIPGLRMSANSY